MPFFNIFASPRWSPLGMRTKVVSFFMFLQELSNKKKIKALRSKMTKITAAPGRTIFASCLQESFDPAQNCPSNSAFLKEEQKGLIIHIVNTGSFR